MYRGIVGGVVLWLAIVTVAGRKRLQVDRQGNWLIADAPLVELELYYEALCPDCSSFIVTSLYPTAQKVGYVMNISLIPYGNAQEKPNKDSWVFTCQHGPKECATNLIETCALNVLARNDTNDVRVSKAALDYIYCIENSGDPPTAGEPCAKKLGADWTAIKTCVGSQRGILLEHEMAVRTEALDPPHTWVPWIVLNGVHTDEIQEAATDDLLKLICDTYTGIRPKTCPPS